MKRAIWWTLLFVVLSIGLLLGFKKTSGKSWKPNVVSSVLFSSKLAPVLEVKFDWVTKSLVQFRAGQNLRTCGMVSVSQGTWAEAAVNLAELPPDDSRVAFDSLLKYSLPCFEFRKYGRFPQEYSKETLRVFAFKNSQGQSVVLVEAREEDELKILAVEYVTVDRPLN